jgi:hypothetical protein
VDENAKGLCHRCVGEEFLKAEIKKTGVMTECFYCRDVHKCLALDQIADHFERAFEQHFFRTPTEPSSLEYAMRVDWYRSGDPTVDVIASTGEISVAIAEDIREVLSERYSDRESYEMQEECEFDEDAHYGSKGVDTFDQMAAWRYFENGLKKKSRYFSKIAGETLTGIFEGISDYSTEAGKPVIVEAGPGTALASLYRARVFQINEKLITALRRPDREIGSPPPQAAASGRMNARGISVFYGATDRLVALAEVRPFVGSRVVSGEFELLRPLRLLDVEAFRSLNVKGSLFDPSYLSRLEKAAFLAELSHLITAPVMPDEEVFEYLPTQAIADFLATEANPALDGILYPSVQGAEGMKNVVLFQKAALVEDLELPRGTKIEAQLATSTEEGEEPDYWVWETTPKPGSTERSVTEHLDAVISSAALPDDFEDRSPTLRLLTSSMQVHHIKKISFEMDDYPVIRHRSEERDWKF